MDLELPLAAARSSSPLAWAFRFDTKGQAIPIPSEEKIQLDCPDGGFVWCHLDLVDTRASDWLSSVDGLPKAARLLMLAQHNHPRLDFGDGFVWGTIIDFTREIDRVAEDVAHLHFVVGEKFMITGRRRHLEAVDALREHIAGGAKMDAPIGLFEHVMDRVVDAHTKLMQQISDGLYEIEDRVLDNTFHGQRHRLGPLRRKAARLLRQLNGIRAIFQRLDAAPSKAVSEEVRGLATRLIQRIDSLHHELHTFQENARLLHDEIEAKRSTETNRNLYILTVLATALMPPTFITGIFGMNVKGLLFTDDQNGFIYAMLMCLASAVAVLIPLRLLRRAR